MKKLIKKTKTLVKGAPTAVVVSILFHAGLFMLAGVLVIFTIVKPMEVIFEPPPPVKVPKMPLKKLQIKLRKPSKPKSTAKITAVVNRPDLHDIQFPDLASSGIGAGLSGGGEVVVFGEMPEFEEEDGIFGKKISIGNDLEGTLYDLKRTRTGNLKMIDHGQYCSIVRKFILDGLKNSTLSSYYRSPTKLYNTHIMFPPVHAQRAMDMFGVPEMESYYFMVHYKGKLVHKEGITFRFRGVGNAVMAVNVDGEEVFLSRNGFSALPGAFTWISSHSDNLKYHLGNRVASVGEWITLEPNTPVDINIAFGDMQGDIFSAMLVVEVKGEKYEKNREGAPILPMFKMENLSRDQREDIEIFLIEDQVNLTNGPVFNDY